MRKEWIFILTILGIILFSGCIGQPKKKEVTGLGVVIKSLTVDPSQLEPNTQAIVSLTIQNQGGAKATNIKPKLIGLPRNEWIVTNASPSTVPHLLPPDPERGVPEGEESYIIWKLTAPEKEVTMTYDFQVRVSYDYNTSSENVIRLMTMDYYLQLPKSERETARKGIITQKYTQGPLKVSVSAPSPIISDFSALPQEGIPIWVTINNVGGGKVLNNLIHIKNVKGAYNYSENVTLINDEYGRFICYLRENETQPIQKFDNFKDFGVSFDLKYTYITDQWTTVTVLKKMTLGLVPLSSLK